MKHYVGSLGNRKRKLVLAFLLLCAASILYAASGEDSLPKFETPVLITTAGQSIDYETIKVISNRLKIANETDNCAKPENLQGKKTLLIVPAHSNKGLGSAGTNVEEEMRRVKMLLAEAAKRGIPIVCMHLGGEVRRSADSDPFISLVLNYAKCAVVWAPGNTDQFFTKKCAEKKIPLIVVNKITDFTGILKSMFPAK